MEKLKGGKAANFLIQWESVKLQKQSRRSVKIQDIDKHLLSVEQNTLKDLIGNSPSKSTWICLKQFCHN